MVQAFKGVFSILNKLDGLYHLELDIISTTTTKQLCHTNQVTINLLTIKDKHN